MERRISVGIFRPTEISGPPPEVIPNIPVGRNRNGPFHLISDRNFRNLWHNGKHPCFAKNTNMFSQPARLGTKWVLCSDWLMGTNGWFYLMLIGYIFHMWKKLEADCTYRFFHMWNIRKREFYLEGLLHENNKWRYDRWYIWCDSTSF